LRNAFIGHSYHQKTKSTAFLLSFLTRLGDLDCYWDESWINGKSLDVGNILARHYDLIVLFQIAIHAPVLSRSGHENTVFVPMYDASGDLPGRFWRSCRNVKILSFSAAMHRKLRVTHPASRYIQYFPDPSTFALASGFDELRGFFWQRTQNITWHHIRRLIAGASFEHFTLHAALDPGRGDLVRPCEEDMARYRIAVTQWFPGRADFLARLQQCNVYFAPRVTEGIGQSFLEALAAGMAVVAPDAPTMNEYITDGVNGYLYDPAHPEPVDFSSAQKVASRARETAEAGYRRWMSSQPELRDFLLTSTRSV